MHRHLVVACLVLVRPGALDAQDTATSPAFEVASVKRTTQAFQERSGFIPVPGRFVAEKVPASALIGYAYRGSLDEMRGEPPWSRNEFYDVTAVPPAGSRQDQWPLMLRNLLIDRFHLAAHVEREERDVLSLVRTQPGAPLPKLLQRVDVDCSVPRPPGTALPPLPDRNDGDMPPCRSMWGGRVINSGGQTMQQLGNILRGYFGKQVVDDTGIEGYYRYVFRYTPTTMPGFPEPTDEFPELTSALRDQLGLKLVPKRAPVNVVVVDRFERPTDN